MAGSSNIVRVNYPSMSLFTSIIGGVNKGSAIDGTGTKATFNNIFGIAWGTSSRDLIFVTDNVNNLVRQFNCQTYTTTNWRVALSGPKGLVVDSSYSNLYVTSSGNGSIAMINIASKLVTFLASSKYGYIDGSPTVARFNSLYGIGIDPSNNLYIADYNTNVFRTVTSTNVYTFAGYGLSGNYVDGYVATQAYFNGPESIVYIGNGFFWAIDGANLRSIGPCTL